MARSKYEIKAEKELIVDGWRVDNKAGMFRFSKHRDFFNTFDLVAYKPGIIRYISIKGHIGGSLRTSHQKEISDFIFPLGVIKELWEWPKTKKKEWRKYIL